MKNEHWTLFHWWSERISAVQINRWNWLIWSKASQSQWKFYSSEFFCFVFVWKMAQKFSRDLHLEKKRKKNKMQKSGASNWAKLHIYSVNWFGNMSVIELWKRRKGKTFIQMKQWEKGKKTSSAKMWVANDTRSE